MSTVHSEERREQARRELATTAIARRVAVLLMGFFLATIGVVPIIEGWRRIEDSARDRPLPLAELPAAFGPALRVAIEEGPIAADRVLLEAIDRAETRLEDESFLRSRLLPPVQALLLRTTGLGNEQVYPGRDGWLFYRADLDHVTGPGFLDPEILERRSRGGDSWAAAPRPDPRDALRELHRDLERRGVALIVVPTPVKPSVHPRRFARRTVDASEPVRNRSFDRLVAELAEEGIEVFDPLPHLLKGGGGGDAYLGTDTHWSPEGLEHVVGALASTLDTRFDLGAASAAYSERPVAVEGRGDLLTMLGLPDGQRLVRSERITIRTVTDGFGSNWRASRSAPVLVLGDSFTNVFSDPDLGWGASAGLAERLSFHLRRPVDRIAQNAGGAYASRAALARDLSAGNDRLAGKVVVLYQFAERELSFGNWRSAPLRAGR